MVNMMILNLRFIFWKFDFKCTGNEKFENNFKVMHRFDETTKKSLYYGEILRYWAVYMRALPVISSS